MIPWGLKTITILSNFVFVLGVYNFLGYKSYSIYKILNLWSWLCLKFTFRIIIAFLRMFCFPSKMVYNLLAACFAQWLRNNFYVSLILQIFISLTSVLYVYLLLFDLINLCSSSGAKMEVDSSILSSRVIP